MNLRNGTDLSFVLYELNVAMDMDTYCELYNPKKLTLYCAKTSTLDLYSQVLALTLGLISIKPEINIQWINFHAFVARLSSVNTCTVGFRVVGEMCGTIINDDGVRKNPVVFNVSVSAAAQHMIYSASYQFKLNMENYAYQIGFLEWQKWKVGFAEKYPYCCDRQKRC